MLFKVSGKINIGRSGWNVALIGIIGRSLEKD